MRFSTSFTWALTVGVLAVPGEARLPRNHKRAVKRADTTTQPALTTTAPVVSTTTKPPASTTTQPATTTSVAAACATDAAALCAAGPSASTCSSPSGQNYDVVCGLKYIGTRSTVLKKSAAVAAKRHAKRQSTATSLAACQATCELYSDCNALNYVGDQCEPLSSVTGVESVPGAIAAAVDGSSVPPANQLLSSSSTSAVAPPESTPAGPTTTNVSVPETTPAVDITTTAAPPASTTGVTDIPETSSIDLTTTAAPPPAQTTAIPDGPTTTTPSTTTSPALTNTCSAISGMTTDSAIGVLGGNNPTVSDCAIGCAQKPGCQAFEYMSTIANAGPQAGKFFSQCYLFSKTIGELTLYKCDTCQNYDLSCFGLTPLAKTTTTTMMTTTTTTSAAVVVETTAVAAN